MNTNKGNQRKSMQMNELSKVNEWKYGKSKVTECKYDESKVNVNANEWVKQSKWMQN